VTTGNGAGFSFFVVGDPQVTATNQIADAWKNTVSTAVAAFPNSRFMISCGDQVDTKDSSAQYEVYLSPNEFKNLPIAQTVGNHDNNSAAFLRYFNPPNLSQLGAGKDPQLSMGDYWFTYDKTLFMVLNSNNYSITPHKQFMEQTIAANPDHNWKIVVFHHSPYSQASYYNDTDRRTKWTPIFDELGIDVVFGGHDHSYTRTFQMIGNRPQKNQILNPEGAAADPAGTLYLALNSSSGSKYYKWAEQSPADFSAARSQNNRPQFSKVTMSNDRFAIMTYEIQIDGSLKEIDAYQITKRTAPPAPLFFLTDCFAKRISQVKLGAWDKRLAARFAPIVFTREYKSPPKAVKK
jgi:hypothetical protein